MGLKADRRSRAQLPSLWAAINSQVFSCRDKGQWEETLASVNFFFFKRASPSLFSFPFMRGAFGRPECSSFLLCLRSFSLSSDHFQFKHSARCSLQRWTSSISSGWSREWRSRDENLSLIQDTHFCSQRRYYTEPQLLILTHFIFCSGCCIRL